jgi:hypothetical protein
MLIIFLVLAICGNCVVVFQICSSIHNIRRLPNFLPRPLRPLQYWCKLFITKTRFPVLSWSLTYTSLLQRILLQRDTDEYFWYVVSQKNSVYYNNLIINNIINTNTKNWRMKYVLCGSKMQLKRSR